MPLYQWRDTWNYAYSPFNDLNDFDASGQNISVSDKKLLSIISK